MEARRGFDRFVKTRTLRSVAALGLLTVGLSGVASAHIGRSPERVITPETPVSGLIQEGNKSVDKSLVDGDQGSLQGVSLSPDFVYIPGKKSVATEIVYDGSQEYIGVVGKENSPREGVLVAIAYRHTDQAGEMTIHPALDLGDADTGNVCIGTGDTIAAAFTDINCWDYTSAPGNKLTFAVGEPQTFDAENIQYRDKPHGPVEVRDIFEEAQATPVATS